MPVCRTCSVRPLAPADSRLAGNDAGSDRERLNRPSQTLYSFGGGLGIGYNSPLVTNNVMPGWLAIGTDYVFLSQDQGNTLAVDGGIGSPFNVAHVNAMVYGGISAGQATFYPISPVSPKANPYLLWVGTSGASGSNLFVQLLNPATPTVNGKSRRALGS